jgi:peptide/nickel transport system ATP-binding protein/oligopeptide transport system ATP-binding protein
MTPVLEVNNLRTYYYTARRIVPAVDGVDFSLNKGEALGIVGESGCGKTTVARSVIGLFDRNYTRIESGKIHFEGLNLTSLSQEELEKIRGKRISFIFQNPATALNPVFTIGYQLTEILKNHESHLGKEDIQNRCVELLELVGIPAAKARLSDYPYQLSGGMQQRVVIATALACNPGLIIADEPTTALDVTIQAQILDLILELKAKFGMSLILITHNMGIIAEMCDRVIVMYGGVVVEEASTDDIFHRPVHPYTTGLLAAIPSLNDEKHELFSIKGTVPRFVHPVTSCRFASRCDKAEQRCFDSEPALYNISGDHKARCHLFSEKGECL